MYTSAAKIFDGSQSLPDLLVAVVIRPMLDYLCVMLLQSQNAPLQTYSVSETAEIDIKYILGKNVTRDCFFSTMNHHHGSNSLVTLL